MKGTSPGLLHSAPGAVRLKSSSILLQGWYDHAAVSQCNLSCARVGPARAAALSLSWPGLNGLNGHPPPLLFNMHFKAWLHVVPVVHTASPHNAARVRRSLTPQVGGYITNWVAARGLGVRFRPSRVPVPAKVWCVVLVAGVGLAVEGKCAAAVGVAAHLRRGKVAQASGLGAALMEAFESS